VKLLAGATFGTNDADIDGDVQCDGCRRSDLNFGTTVGGDVQIKEAQEGSVNTGTFPGAPRLRVGGDVEFVGNQGGLTSSTPMSRETSRPRAPRLPVGRRRRPAQHGAR